MIKCITIPTKHLLDFEYNITNAEILFKEINSILLINHIKDEDVINVVVQPNGSYLVWYRLKEEGK